MMDISVLAAPKRLRRITRCIELHNLENVPDFLRDNDFILLGYRTQLTVWTAAKSIFAVHNETVNIWTHLLGSIAILVLAVTTVPVVGNAWPIYLFDAAACACLTISWLAHTFCCIGPVAYRRMWRLDHGAIVLLQVSEFVPFCIYLFDAPISAAYISIALFIGATVLILSSMQQFQMPAWRKYRTACFAMVGGFGVVPLIHASIVEDWRAAGSVFELTFCNLACMGLGGVLFATRFPERCVRTPCLNFIGSSHNLLHVSIACGFIAYHFACLGMLDLSR